MRNPTPYALRVRSGVSAKSDSFEACSKYGVKKYNLPKGYLSYSAIMLWKNNKEAFRDKYYRGISIPETPYMIFGKKIAKKLETDEYRSDPVLSKIPIFGKAEWPIKINIGGVPIVAYIDRFSNQLKAFKEYKTGILSPAGKVPWDPVKVARHDQLPFYSFLIYERYKKYQPTCELVWMETRWKKKKIEWEGMELEGNSSELELTGKFEVFKRKIYRWEHNRIRRMILTAAKEISDDYTKYQQDAPRSN